MQARRLRHREVFVPLRHDPGHAQVDFGEALAEIAGVERKIHFSTPMTDRTSMILQWVYRNDTEEQVSSADVVAFDRAVTLEDKRILESCDADVPLADTDGEEMHMRTDYPGVVMRRMLAKLVADHGETEQRAGG